jgi:heme/copper-type cytochrome/quinol oxidase subunit 4
MQVGMTMHQTPTERSRWRSPTALIGALVVILAIVLVVYLMASGGGGGGGGGGGY